MGGQIQEQALLDDHSTGSKFLVRLIHGIFVHVIHGIGRTSICVLFACSSPCTDTAEVFHLHVVSFRGGACGAQLLASPASNTSPRINTNHNTTGGGGVFTSTPV
eukprot:scaffold2858_cov659-Pavlova_lutheri.AAC.156